MHANAIYPVRAAETPRFHPSLAQLERKTQLRHYQATRRQSQMNHVESCMLAEINKGRNAVLKRPARGAGGVFHAAPFHVIHRQAQVSQKVGDIVQMSASEERILWMGALLLQDDSIECDALKGATACEMIKTCLCSPPTGSYRCLCFWWFLLFQHRLTASLTRSQSLYTIDPMKNTLTLCSTVTSFE